MALPTIVPWWQRLLLGSCAVAFTLLLLIALVAIRDFHRDPDLQWFNAGEIQVVGYIGIVGGIAGLAFYLFFVVPLVLLWPVGSQLKHWYAVLCAATGWPTFADALLHRRDLPTFLQGFRYPQFYLLPELFAICACGGYLLLLYWRDRRLKTRRREMAE